MIQVDRPARHVKIRAMLTRDLTIAALIAGFSAPFVRTGDGAALTRDLTIAADPSVVG